MADEALVAGLEKVQVDESQQTGNLKASKEENSVVPKKLQCDSSKSDDSRSKKEKPAFSAKKLPKIEEKKVIERTKGDPITTDKLQCDSSRSKSSRDENSKTNSKSRSGDDSKSSKSASKDDFKHQSGSTGNLKGSKEENSIVPKKLQFDSSESDDSGSDKEKLAFSVKKLPKREEKKVIEKTKGDPSTTDKLQCDISSSKISRNVNSKSESKYGSRDDSKSSKTTSKDDFKYKSGYTGNLKASKEENNIVTKKLQFDSSESDDSGSDKEKPAFSAKKLPKREEKKVIEKTKGDPNTTDKLRYDISSSQISRNVNSKSESMSGSGDLSKSSDDFKYTSGSTAKKKKEKSGEENQTVSDPLMVSPVAKADEPTATENSKLTQEIREDQNAGKEVKNDDASAEREKEKKSIVGKIMEKLPGYYRNSGE